MMLTFDIVPVAKGRPRATRTGIVYTPSKTRCYERDIAILAKGQMSNVLPYSGALRVDITFFMPMPKSWSIAKREIYHGSGHTSRPDKDNLEKGLLDALNGIVWIDDSQIWSSTVRKVWASKGAIKMRVEF